MYPNTKIVVKKNVFRERRTNIDRQIHLFITSEWWYDYNKVIIIIHQKQKKKRFSDNVI